MYVLANILGIQKEVLNENVREKMFSHGLSRS